MGFASTFHDLSSTCDVTASPGPAYCGPGNQWDPVASACLVAHPADVDFDAFVSVSHVLQVLSVFGQCFDCCVKRGGTPSAKTLISSLAAILSSLVNRYRFSNLKVVGLVLLKMVK